METPSKEPDAEQGDMFTGRVVSASKTRQTVTVAFDSTNGKHSPRVGKGKGEYEMM